MSDYIAHITLKQTVRLRSGLIFMSVIGAVMVVLIRWLGGMMIGFMGV